MLRLFASIRQSLLNENKTVRYLKYAVGEIVLIMIGIFLALQLNNWNEDRKERSQERVILAEIQEEFLYNKEEFENVWNGRRDLLARLETLIEAFPLDLETFDLESLAETLDLSHATGDFDESSTSLDKLKSTSFDIISNEELRNLLLRWEVLTLDFQQREELYFKFQLEQFEPVLRDHFSRPYREGFKDPRANLEFLTSLTFEGLIKSKRDSVRRLVSIAENAVDDRNILTVINRIIELSEPDE